MPKKAAALDYEKCRPDKCGNGVCLASLECERGSLVQSSPNEPPEINPGRWCRGCAKCAAACPFKAIRML